MQTFQGCLSKKLPRGRWNISTAFGFSSSLVCRIVFHVFEEQDLSRQFGCGTCYPRLHLTPHELNTRGYTPGGWGESVKYMLTTSRQRNGQCHPPHEVQTKSKSFLFFSPPIIKKIWQGTSWADHGMTPAAGRELNEKILAGLFSESNVELLAPTFSLRQYAGNWIINSLLTRSRKHSGFSFFRRLKVHVWWTSRLVVGRDGGVLSAPWWVRFISAPLALLHAPLSFFFLIPSFPLLLCSVLPLFFWVMIWAGRLFCPGLFLDVLLRKTKKKKKKIKNRDAEKKGETLPCGLKI